jgi:hypothetical protein
MDKPQVDRIERIPPAIAIDQVNPVRTSRSTVGTMTEINDHLKLLYARAARLHCRRCGRQVRRDSAQSIADALPAALAGFDQALLLVCFPVPLPPKMKLAELRAELEKLGYVRIHQEQPRLLTVIQDRLPRCARATAAPASTYPTPRARSARCCAIPATCTVPTATCTIRMRRRGCSRSIPRSAPATPAVASAA